MTNNNLSLKKQCFVPLNHFSLCEGLHRDPLFHLNFLLWWKFALWGHCNAYAFSSAARMEENITHDMFCVGLHHSYKYSMWVLALCQCSCITIPLLIVSHTYTYYQRWKEYVILYLELKLQRSYIKIPIQVFVKIFDCQFSAN